MTLAPSMLFTQAAIPSVMMYKAMKSSKCCQAKDMIFSFFVIFDCTSCDVVFRVDYYLRNGSIVLSSSAFCITPLVLQSPSPLRNSMRVGAD